MQLVNVTVDGAVAWLELNRPEVLNAWSDEIARELRAALEAAESDPVVRVVVITGAGRAFSAGGDLKEELPRTPDGFVDLRRRITTVSAPLIKAIRRCPKPVIAMVNGPAVGIGCSLALACDLLVAAESAYFLLPFTRIGLIPDGAALTFLVARIGVARATELALLADRLNAQQALQWGLANRVVADADLRAMTAELADGLAAGPPLAYANTKRMVNAVAYPELDHRLVLEAELQQEQAESGEYAEGVAAFRAKRPPVFEGVVR